MLREIPKVRQIEGEPHRRWFTDDHFDLVLWDDESRQIVGFQLCYDKHDGERAITWKEDSGFSLNGCNSDLLPKQDNSSKGDNHKRRNINADLR